MLQNDLRIAGRAAIGQGELLRLKVQLPILTEQTKRLKELEDARMKGGLRCSTGEYVQIYVGCPEGAIMFGPGVSVGPDVFNSYEKITSALCRDGQYGTINELGYFIVTNPDKVKATLSKDELSVLAEIFEEVSRAFINHNDFKYDDEMDTLRSWSRQKHSSTEKPYNQIYGHPQGQLKEAYKLSVIATHLRNLAAEK